MIRNYAKLQQLNVVHCYYIAHNSQTTA